MLLVHQITGEPQREFRLAHSSRTEKQETPTRAADFRQTQFAAMKEVNRQLAVVQAEREAITSGTKGAPRPRQNFFSAFVQRRQSE